MQREIDALRASSEKYDSFAKAQRAKWHSGTAHPDRGQKMLREGHKANLQMAKKKQLGIDADLDYAAKLVAMAGYMMTGQVCTATSRAIVDEKVADEFTEKLVAEAQARSEREGL